MLPDLRSSQKSEKRFVDKGSNMLAGISSEVPPVYALSTDQWIEWLEKLTGKQLETQQRGPKENQWRKCEYADAAYRN